MNKTADTNAANGHYTSNRVLTLLTLVNNNNKYQLLSPLSILRDNIDTVMSMYSLVFHEDEVEYAVKYGVYQVCQSEVENEKICNSSHPPVS